MHFVALTEWRDAGVDLAALAPSLGTTAYELRLVLNAGFPAVVRITPDEAEARALLATLERAGQRAVVCDRRTVVPSSRMTTLRDFRLDAAGIVATAAGTDVLPYADVAALIRAGHRTASETTTDVKERKLRPMAALATGGLITSKTTTRQVTTREVNHEQALYLFRHSGSPPWILLERGARYGCLGAKMAPSSLENFGATVAALRERCPGAAYDDRLMTARMIRGLPDAIGSADMLAYLVFAAISAPAAR